MDKGRYEYFLEKYRDVPASIIKQYKDPDEWVVMNEDKHLHPIWIPLPKPPEWHEIDGWGLPAREQKFQKQEIPKKLRKLIEQCTTVDEIWEQLENRQTEFRKEIKWIELQWKRYKEGYWFFCNGKPTHIVGWHYVYLNFWKFKTETSPQYRDRNRKFYHAMYYAYTTTETIAYTDQGKIIYEDEQLRRPKMIDTGFRTFYGIAYPKHRKDGASNMCLCGQYMETITHKGVVGGNISMTGTHCETKIFNEIIVPGWNQMPFFFKPKTTSNKNPGSQIAFFESRSRADKLKTHELGSIINYSTTSTASMYDGGNNIWINRDEAGKTVETDVYIDHAQLKPCVALGGGTNIFGFLTYPSTVGEMEGAGGRNFYNICQDSQFEKRNRTGQTASGLMVLYMPAYEGLEGFIGEYGESIIETPTPEQMVFIKRTMGAREYLQDQRNQLEKDNKIEAYNELVRLFPTAYKECFRTSDGDIGFNTRILNDRIDVLTMQGNDSVRRGNFKWLKGERHTQVYFEDDINGRWVVSKILNEDQANRFYIRKVSGKEQRFPIDSKFTASADAFKFNETQHSRMSLGGGGVLWNYDATIDQGIDIQYWKTHRFVCSYIYRPPTTKEYAEDMLMMCVYFGAMMYPENNIDLIWRHFEDEGYMGFLQFDIDHKTNKIKTTPGFNATEISKQTVFNEIRDHIELHGHRECHLDMLQQCKDITDMSEMTDYDLIPVMGGCLMGAKSKLGKIIPLKKEEAKITTFYPKINYSNLNR